MLSGNRKAQAEVAVISLSYRLVHGFPRHERCLMHTTPPPSDANHKRPNTNGSNGITTFTDKDFQLSRETWRLFRIMSEFVDGFEVMTEVGPAVSVFGSARTPETDPVYAQAVECGKQITDKGLAVITGGGPGVMEAANRGAMEAGGKSVGLNIHLPMEQDANPYQTHSLTFRYFFVRKVMFVKYACGFIIFPGGFGTMDEFFEAMTLIQTTKIEPFPVVCIDKKFWGGMIDWIKNVMRDQYATISPGDLDLFTTTDTVEEAVEFIYNCYDHDAWLRRSGPESIDQLIEYSAEGMKSRKPSDPS